MTLADMTYNVVTASGGGCHVPAIEGAGFEPAGRDLSDFEQDLREWGVVYGAAYGIACSESPFESAESRAERALEAAREVDAMGSWSEREVGA
jgi:hypothetical protein